MAQSVDRIRERLLRAAAALRGAGLTYAVVGGNAVAAWVSRADESAVRNTRDIDLLLRRADFEKACRALEAAGFQFRHMVALGRREGMDVFLDGPNGKVRDALHILWAGERITEDSQELAPEPEGAEESGGFALVPLAPLVQMKLTAFRDKDRMHLRDLLAVGLIDESWTEKVPVSLADRLRVILADPFG